MSTHVSVVSNRYETVTREADSDDRWDRDDTLTEWHVSGIKVVPDRDYFDVIVPFDVDKQGWYWLVYVIYSTGDSFGYDQNGCMEVLDLFIDGSKAQACADAVSGDNTSVTWIREDGSEGKLGYVPWNGYFESLSYVRFEKVAVI